MHHPGWALSHSNSDTSTFTCLEGSSDNRSRDVRIHHICTMIPELNSRESFHCSGIWTHVSSVLGKLVLPETSPCTLCGSNLGLDVVEDHSHDAQAAEGRRQEGQHCHIDQEKGCCLRHRRAQEVDDACWVVEPLHTEHNSVKNSGSRSTSHRICCERITNLYSAQGMQSQAINQNDKG